MHRIGVFLVVVGLGFGAAIPAAAENPDWIRTHVSGTAGYVSFDEALGIDTGVSLAGRLGFSFYRYLEVEGAYGKVYGDREVVPSREFPVDHFGVDLMLIPLPDSRVRPYLLGGWTQLNLDEPNQETLRLNGWEFGAGAMVLLKRHHDHDLDLRIDFRSLSTKLDEPLVGAGETASSWVLSLGLQVSVPPGIRDRDSDGVPDGLDQCPGTRWGTAVDEHGCPLDSDGDGVLDHRDICPNTRPGLQVDEKGCPVDRNGDGIPDRK